MSIAFGGWKKLLSGRNVLFVGLVGLTLAACGRFAYERREAWREELERRCLTSGAVQMSRYVQRADRSLNGPGACGIDYPLKVSAISRGQVGFNQTQTLACQMVPTLDRWIDREVQPAAQRWLGASIVEVKAGSYSCRPKNSQRGSSLSEHSYGNALDVFSFVLSDGREVVIRKSFNDRADPASSGFLRDIFIRACDHFTTVLGPGSNQFHYDHFHLDLARHSADWSKRICSPKPELVQLPPVPPDRSRFRLF